MKKKRINEKLGGGQKIGLGGVNSSGPHYSRQTSSRPSGYHTGGYSGSPDNQFSQRLSLVATIEENEKDQNEDNIDMSEEKETLYEYFARIAKLPLNENKTNEGGCDIEEGHCKTHESSCSMKEDQCDESLRMQEEREIEEMSSGGVPGVATPLGTNAKGKVPSNKQRKERIQAANIYKK